MITNYPVLSQIKKISWNQRTSFLEVNPNDKFLSTYKIFEALQKPKDWVAIATKCSINPNHEMFGVEPDMILQLWQSKGQKGADRGIGLDTYITARLQSSEFDKSLVTDANLLAKFEQFDIAYDKVFSKLHSYVGSEIWLNSAQLGVSVRCDSMFTVSNDRTCYIPDWKNNEKLSTVNAYRQKLLGPLNNIDDTDLAKYTLQTHIYRYIVENSMSSIFDSVKTSIVNFTSTEMKTWSGAFEYDSKLIEEIVKFSKQHYQSKQE